MIFMRKTLIFTILASLWLLIAPVFIFAQGNDSTAIEEARGQEILQKLRDKQVACQNLTDDDFEKLGEYFMGQFIGNPERHATMNQMMQNMMGQNTEEQIHIILGKRSSGCETNASFMRGGGSSMMGYGGWGGMMNGWGGFGLFGWILILLGVVLIFRHLSGSGQGKEDKTPLDILKERYAKGEIDKKEFEDKKKDLG